MGGREGERPRPPALLRVCGPAVVAVDSKQARLRSGGRRGWAQCGPGLCASSVGDAPADRSGSRQRPAYQSAAAIPADRRAPHAPPRLLMHFLFPSLSVETVFPVSDLHCSSRLTPVGMLISRAPATSAVALGWAGKEAAPCLRSAGTRVEAAELLKVFHCHGPSWHELSGLAGSRAECRFCHGPGIQSAKASAGGSLRWPSRPRPPLPLGPRCPRPRSP